MYIAAAAAAVCTAFSRTCLQATVPAYVATARTQNEPTAASFMGMRWDARVKTTRCKQNFANCQTAWLAMVLHLMRELPTEYRRLRRRAVIATGPSLVRPGAHICGRPVEALMVRRLAGRQSLRTYSNQILGAIIVHGAFLQGEVPSCSHAADS